MFSSAMGILYMVYLDDYTFLFLPLSTIIGGSYYFMKDYECEYAVRDSYTPKKTNNKNLFSLENDYSPYFNDYTPTVYHNSKGKNPSRNVYVSPRDSEIYKEIVNNKKKSTNIMLVD